MTIRMQAAAESDPEKRAGAGATTAVVASFPFVAHRDRPPVVGLNGGLAIQPQRVHEVRRTVENIRVAVPGLRVRRVRCRKTRRVGREPAAPDGVMLPHQEIVQRIRTGGNRVLVHPREVAVGRPCFRVIFSVGSVRAVVVHPARWRRGEARGTEPIWVPVVAERRAIDVHSRTPARQRHESLREPLAVHQCKLIPRRSRRPYRYASRRESSNKDFI